MTQTRGQTFCYSKNIKRLLDDKTWHTITVILLIFNIFLLLIFCKGGFWTKNSISINKGDYRLANQIENDCC